MRRQTDVAVVFSLSENLFEDRIATTGRTLIAHLLNLSLFIADGHLAALARRSSNRREISQIDEDAFGGNATIFVMQPNDPV